jgi:chemotaxis protein MotB
MKFTQRIVSTAAGLALVCGPLAGCCGKYKDQIAGLETENAKITKERNEYKDAKEELDLKLAGLMEYQQALEGELEALGVDKAMLAEKYKAAEGKLADKMAALEAAQTEMDEIMADLETKKKIITEMKKKEEQAEARLATLKNMLGKFKALIEGGKLKVKVKNGKLMLELPSAILFESGKADLSEQGMETLSEVAAVLSTIGDREFQVAGHTDDVPMKSKKFPSNWELSTARAVAVVKYLEEMGVKPTNLSAAGYSEFQPATGNDTEEGKALNRRIEITLMPNLDELPDLSELEGEISK